MAYVASFTTSAYQTRENSRFVCLILGRIIWIGEEFLPRVKSMLFLSGGQEKNSYTRVKSRISLSGGQESFLLNLL